ncbi:hypothetical protein FNYG_15806 [Fusarium nygamai]|uniref:Uncharacterized protein n=1 Tax=Gibberella nygamai TaxID=42673 RepID=A0A2K0U4L2_GIBNY|nr:hypothetical protein FNYG_15806 [Fusarium nygamai]
MDELIAASQARLKEEDAARLRKGDLKEDIDRDSPWVKRLGWVRHFGSRDLISIHDAAEWLRARAATGRLAGKQEDEEAARERLLLSRLGQSFDREVDRCCWLLDSVPTETLQWLGSITSMTPSGVPFGRKGKEESTSLWIHSLSLTVDVSASPLADNPCINPALHLHLKEGSQYMCSAQSSSQSGDLAISLVDFAFSPLKSFDFKLFK